MFAFLGFLPEFCIIFCNLLKMMLSICTCESQDSHTLPEKPRLLVADCSSFLSKGNMKGSSFKRNWHSKEAGFQKHLVFNFIKNWAFFSPLSFQSKAPRISVTIQVWEALLTSSSHWSWSVCASFWIVHSSWSILSPNQTQYYWYLTWVFSFLHGLNSYVTSLILSDVNLQLLLNLVLLKYFRAERGMCLLSCLLLWRSLERWLWREPNFGPSICTLLALAVPRLWKTIPSSLWIPPRPSPGKYLPAVGQSTRR